MSPPPPPPSATAPKGLTAWRQRLLAVPPPLLSPPDVLAELQSDDLPTARLIDALQRDLPLGLAVLLESQKRLRGRPIVGLSHAVGLLGLNGVQSVIQRLAALPALNPTHPGHQAYAEAVATSRLAAHLAAEFASDCFLDERLRRMWEMQVLMMAEWRLPLAAPALAQQMAQRIAAGERPARVEQALLGCQMHQLNTALALHYGLLEKDEYRHTQNLNVRWLGQAARLAWTGLNPPPLPTDLGRWLLQPTTLPALLHLLAQEAMRSWYSPRIRLLQNAISAQRRWRIEEVMLATRRAAVAASHEMMTRGVLIPPAARLLWAPWKRTDRSQHPPAMPSVAATPPPTAAIPGPHTHTIERGSPARVLIDQFVDECINDRHPDLPAFFQAFGHTLSDGLDLTRFALFLKTSHNEQMVCFMARGFGPQVIPKRYTVPLGDDNLLAKVFSQPHGFLLGQGHRLGPLRQRLPETLRQELHPGGAIWGAIQVNERAVGVIWADAGAAASNIDEAQYAGFKLVCRHFGAALTHLMKQQKAQRNNSSG